MSTAPRSLALAGALTLGSCLTLDDLSSYSASTGTPATAESLPVATPEMSPVLGAGDPKSNPSLDIIDPTRGPLSGTADGGALEPEPECSAADELLDAIDRVCYHLSTNAVPWLTAAFACRALQSDLVSINSEREDELLAAWLPRTVWTGGNDRAGEGTFSWQSGDPFEFVRFAAGEPNDLFSAQDCIEKQLRDGLWHDRDCGVRNRYVCERALLP